jgi:hypothetical protein
MNKLVLHVGAGKTGSTSIQEFCDSNKQSLMKLGVFYVGYCFENLKNKKFSWQKSNGFEDLYRSKVIEQELSIAISDAINEAKASGCHICLWSNEALFNRPKIQNFFEKFSQPFDTVAYVRSHEQWVKSAYSQWGIKHKTYQGPTKTFSDWVKSVNLNFGRNAQYWEKVSNHFYMRNFDNVDNVVSDFFELLNIDIRNLNSAVVRNTSESLLQTKIRVIFNNNFSKEIQANRIGKLYQKSYLNSTKISTDYLPNKDDLSIIAESTRHDKKILNTYLPERHQFKLNQTFTNSDSPQGPTSVGYTETEEMMATLIANLAARVEEIGELYKENQIKEPDRKVVTLQDKNIKKIEKDIQELIQTNKVLEEQLSNLKHELAMSFWQRALKFIKEKF